MRSAVNSHGTVAYGQAHQCRCEPCRLSVNAYNKRLRYEKAHGVYRRVDAEPTRRHVRGLTLRGVNFDQIARATNNRVKTNQIQRLLEGGANGKKVAYLLRPTATVLLAVTFEQAASQNARISALHGLRRRLQALTYMGYGTTELARHLGITPKAMSTLMTREVITLRTLWKVEEMYRQWSMTTGPNERARWVAYRRDYAPPMAWDEDTIDDPLAGPESSAIACVVAHCGRPASKHSLCPQHVRTCLQLDGFRSSERFRIVVLRMGTRRSNNHDQMMTQLADFKALGVAPAEAAARIHCTVDYVEQMYREIA